MQDKITKQKLEKYFNITEKALKKARKKIIKGKEKEAKEIINMAENTAGIATPTSAPKNTRGFTHTTHLSQTSRIINNWPVSIV